MNPRDGVRRLWRLLDREPSRGGSSRRGPFGRIDTRIVVTGTDGRRTAARWLCEVLAERGRDVCALLGGAEPRVVSDGFEFPAEGGVDGLVRSVRAFDPGDALIVENGGPDERTMGLVNARVDPRHVLLTNVRSDPGALGDRWATARAIARSVPRGAHVVSGEDDPDVHRRLATELARRDATITHVPVPDAHADVPRSECVYAVDWLLRSVDKFGLGERTGDYLDRLRVRWTGLPGGRACVAADATDVETLERVRKWLVPDDAPIQPLVVLRDGDPARIESYVRYLNDLADGDLVERVRIVGDEPTAVAREVRVPVTTHGREDPAAVLDAALADGLPVWVVANAPSPFLADLEREIRRRATAERRGFRSATAGDPTPQVVAVDDAAGPAAWLGRAVPAGRDVLVVDYAGDPGAWTRERAGSRRRGRLRVVTVGGRDPAVASRGGAAGVETVADPADLDAVAALVDAYLAGWDGPTAVCCGPVAALFGAVGYGAALGFVRAVAERSREAGAVAYFSVDPDAHDGRTLRSLRRAVGSDPAGTPESRPAARHERVPARRGGPSRTR